MDYITTFAQPPKLLSVVSVPALLAMILPVSFTVAQDHIPAASDYFYCERIFRKMMRVRGGRNLSNDCSYRRLVDLDAMNLGEPDGIEALRASGMFRCYAYTHARENLLLRNLFQQPPARLCLRRHALLAGSGNVWKYLRGEAVEVPVRLQPTGAAFLFSVAHRFKNYEEVGAMFVERARDRTYQECAD